MTKISTIYVDMDGVLTNFDKQFSLLNQDTLFPKEFIAQYGEEKFWDLINKEGIKFWHLMEWNPGGMKLINFLLKNFNPKNIILLTTPSYEIESKIGKHLWIKDQLHNKFKVIFSFNKEEYATPNNILIDDRNENIKKWNGANGIGILHIDIDTTLKKLKHII